MEGHGQRVFRCLACGSTQFNLLVNPAHAARVTVGVNAHGEITIDTGTGRTFVADLMFMNQFAVCTCGEIRQWEYYFPSEPESEEPGLEPKKPSKRVPVAPGAGKATGKPKGRKRSPSEAS